MAFDQSLGVLIAYSAAVVLASVLGGMLPEWIRLTHERMQFMISFVGGLMLGIAIFHMIPHALVATRGDADRVAWGLIAGLLVTFFLLRFFHFHQHGPADFGLYAEERKAARGSAASSALAETSTHICSEHVHPQDHDRCQDTAAGSPRWVFVFMGLALHTLTDGVALASGVMSEVGHDAWSAWPGLGIFLAVLLHKPLDAVSITSLMHPVTTATHRLVVNVGFALMCPLGALLFWAGVAGQNEIAAAVAGFGLAFSAGVFLCISLSDLLPEMEFHSHNRLQLTGALLLGIAAAWAIGMVEGKHAHEHGPPNSTVPHAHADHSDHAGHEH
ncbi:MAG: hypothetical protein D6753_10040 [Planctomycetota bacterium]|nr:MAG: hypothetical protein D6753_10040 [Planctomycetota bacterium]